MRCARDCAALRDQRRLAGCELPGMKVEIHRHGLIPAWDSTAEVKGAKALKFLKSSVDFIDAGSRPTRMRDGGFLGLRNQ